ncbi:hypothetical protein [Trueperella sp. LYQ143]|uniref:hypothetical protein n=1 Tax=Trueperella sp. LYQ143 TaxID=3391059 RepID=UPI0039832119
MLSSLINGVAQGFVRKAHDKQRSKNNPYDPVVKKPALAVAFVGVLLLLISVLVVMGAWQDRQHGGVAMALAIGVPLVGVCVALILIGTSLHSGVDDARIWLFLGRIWRREVYFEQVDAIKYVGQTGWVRVSANGISQTVTSQSEGAALVYIRILEELQYRRIVINGISVRDVRWEDEAHMLRKYLLTYVFIAHRVYLESHPQTRLALANLLRTPVEYSRREFLENYSRPTESANSVVADTGNIVQHDPAYGVGISEGSIPIRHSFNAETPFMPTNKTRWRPEGDSGGWGGRVRHPGRDAKPRRGLKLFFLGLFFPAAAFLVDVALVGIFENAEYSTYHTVETVAAVVFVASLLVCLCCWVAAIVSAVRRKEPPTL